MADLRRLLLKVIQDYKLKVNVLRNSRRVTSDDLLRLLADRAVSHREGRLSGPAQRCHACG